MNLTGTTRVQAVLEFLRAAKREGDGWVLGTELMSPQVGGSAGDSRVRGLRRKGYDIKSRRSPNPKIDSWEYRLFSEPEDSMPGPEPVTPYVAWTPDRGGFKALLQGAHLQVFCNLDRTQWYWTSKGLVKGGGGPGTLDAMKRAAILAVVSHR